MEYVKMFELALSITDKLMDKMPNYEQKKRKQFYNLRSRYQEEKNMEDRDDNLLGHYRDQLLIFLDAFDKELSI